MAGPWEVILASPRSVCAGVERAIEAVRVVLATSGPPVYVRKQIVHNTHVVAELTGRGAVSVENLDEVPDGAVVVFSAHGVSPAVRATAAKRGLRVVDATCPRVAKVHVEAKRYAAQGYTIVLIGHAGHEEVEGTLGQAPDRTVLVRRVDDVMDLRIPDPDRVVLLIQTTLAVDETAEIIAVMRARFPAVTRPSGGDICYATTNRQNAVPAVARHCDLVLVVGSANSSNSVRMVEIARREGVSAYLIDDADQIEARWLAGVRCVGVSAGASAPQRLVDDVVSHLRSLGPLRIRELAIATEDMRFALPWPAITHAAQTPEDLP